MIVEQFGLLSEAQKAQRKWMEKGAGRRSPGRLEVALSQAVTAGVQHLFEHYAFYFDVSKLERHVLGIRACVVLC